MLNNGLNITKKDYLIGALAGLFTGILALRIFTILEINFEFQKEFLLFGIPVLWAFGVALGGFLGKWVSFFSQFGKFAAVGFLGTAIDFLMLNSISNATGITAGLVVGWINIPGFLIAVSNNYFWNKLWVFKKTGNIFENFPKFLAITTAGLFINSGIIIFLTTFLGPYFDISSNVWLNVSKVVATGVTLTWNFMGYKFVAFKS